MRSMEFSGRSVDEAVFHGLMEMGVSIDEVEIETLQGESKGLFGIGAKMARVRLTERDPSYLSDKMEQEAADERIPDTNDVPRQPTPRRDNPRRDNGRRDNNRRDNAPRRDSAPVRDVREEEPAEPEVVYAYSEELANSMPAAAFLKELLRDMGIEAKVAAAEVEDGIRLRIDSDAMGILIGRRGETLDALQYITSLVVNKNRKQEGYVRVTLDTEDYRAKREETLRRLARRQASRVRTTGRPIALEPMNPYERRVLHASLQNNPYVSTHSEGEEPNRRVVITPNK
ncbi:MAG: protein jag [Eubacteriales bacterium]|nr:protein jag [Eubacteriales bacterium]